MKKINSKKIIKKTRTSLLKKKFQKRLFIIFLFLIQEKQIIFSSTFRKIGLKNKLLTFFFKKFLLKNNRYVPNLVNVNQLFNLFLMKFNFLKQEVLVILFNTLNLFKVILNEKKNLQSFYTKQTQSCGIVRAFLSFTKIFILLTNLKGELKAWVSAGSGNFKKKRERTTPQVPISLCLRMSNVIRRKKFKFIKIVIAGPSKKYKSRVFQTLANRSWIRKYSIKCIEEFFPKAYNGCRLVKEKRR